VSKASFARTGGLALLGGVCFAFSGAALAQEQSEPAAKESVEEVVVTGSRIARTNLEGLGPITVLSAEDISSSGVGTVDELLRELPSVGFGGISQNANNGGRGLRFIDLRNLGSARTLVLVNNRRFVTNGSGVAEAVDINNIPTALIERIDVLRDGVSTIYGSDAVAGVVNFILKDDYEGFSAELAGGISEQGDAEEGGLSLLWGKNWSKANLTLSGQIFNREEVDQFDRDFARFPVSQSNFTVQGDPTQGVTSVIGSNNVVEGRFGNNVFFKPGLDANGNPSDITAFNILDQTDIYNFAKAQYLTPEQTRYTFNGTFRYELSDSLEFFAEGEYAQRYGRQILAPVPLSNTASRANPAGLTFPIFRDASRNNPFLPQAAVNTLLGPTADMRSVGFVRRLQEVGNRVTNNDSLTTRVVTGFRGELDGPLGPLNWEVFGNVGRNENTELIDNNVNVTRVLATLQPELCAQTPGCSVGNYFGENALLTTPDAINFIRFQSRDRLGFNLREVGTSLSGGLFNLPAGEVKGAIGAEYREEDGFVSPDAFTVSGDSSTNGLDPTRGQFTTRSAFFETSVPIIAGKFLAEELTLEISGRVTDYSSFGSKYLSRYGFSWAPVTEFRLRGVYATAFRAPGISDLFGGGADAFLALTDPCNGFGSAGFNDPSGNRTANCAALLPSQYNAQNPFNQLAVGNGQQLRANIGGNPDLQEEVAKTLNFGFVYQPSFMPDLSIAADYYRVEIDDPIVNPDPQNTLNNCIDSPNLIASECAVQRRNPMDGSVSFLGVATTNLGKTEVNGVDVEMNYALELPILGPATLGMQGSYVFNYLDIDDSGSDQQNGYGIIPNFKGRFTSSVQPTDDLRLTLTSRYIGGSEFKNRRELKQPFDNTPGVWYLDTSGQYSLGENYTFTMGIRNLTDKKPPFTIGAANTTLAEYDVLGRYFFARVQASF
jgi:iron complex outermembrane recepter protein